MFTPLSITYGSVLSAVAIAELGLFIYFLRYEKTESTKAFLWVILGTVIWVGANAIAAFHSNADVTFIEKFTYFGGTILSTSFLVFINAFPYPKSDFIKTLKYLPLVSTIFFGYTLFFTTTFLGELSINNGFSTEAQQGLSLYIWTVFFLVVWALSLKELIIRFKENIGETRRRLLYLLIGISISLFVGVISDVIFPLFNATTFLPLASSFSVVWLIFMIKGIRYQEKRK